MNACLEAGLHVLVCDPRKLDLKKLGKKTDRRDARELARRLLVGVWVMLTRGEAFDLRRCLGQA